MSSGRFADGVIQWIADRVSDSLLGDLSKSQIAKHLSDLGLEAWIVAAIAPVLAIVAVKMFWKLLEPPPNLDWSVLDPDNDQAMATAFNDIHTVATVSKYLNENDAQTLEVFKDQIRRLASIRDQIRKDMQRR